MHETPSRSFSRGWRFAAHTTGNMNSHHERIGTRWFVARVSGEVSIFLCSFASRVQIDCVFRFERELLESDQGWERCLTSGTSCGLS